MRYKAYIESKVGGYGFGHYWYLYIKKSDVFKRFYLGQDVKFLNRVLGIDSDYIKYKLGINEAIDFEKYNEKITNLVINILSNNEDRGLKKPKVKVIDAILNCEEWAFSGE